MATFLLVHGSWLGGWCWRRVTPSVLAAGHEVFAPSLTGLGDRAHLGGTEVDLQLHLRDLVAVIESEELDKVILVGHSYAGMLITGIADLMPRRIAQLVYLDAVVPENGQSVCDIIPSEMAAGLRRMAQDQPGNRFPPASPEAMGIADPTDAAWVKSHAVGMPLRTHEQPIVLRGAHAAVKRRAYIACTRPALGALAGATRKAREAGWDYFEIPTGHDAMVTAPQELTEILLRLSRI